MSRLVRASIVFAAQALASVALAQTVWHVDASAPAGGNGTAWGSAFTGLTDALAVATSGDQIWIADGVYKPIASSADPRDARFTLGPGLKLYGGFAGGETSVAQRAGLFSTTVLSADLGTPLDPSDNAYHVIVTWGSVVVDGFRIEGGNAIGDASPNGGGIFCTTGQVQTNPPLYAGSSLKLRNCTLVGHRGQRGAALYAQLGNLAVAHCVFDNNESTGTGGALFLQTTVARFDLCRFRRNKAGSNGGVATLTSIATTPAPTLRPRVEFFGCLFHDNSAAQNGGAIYMGGSEFTSGKGAFTNCTFSLNQAGVSGGALAAVTTSQIPARSYVENSIVWSNRAPASPELAGTHFVWNSIAPGQTGTNLVLGPPRFVNLSLRNFHLQPNSPAIDAGSDARVLYDLLDVDDDGSVFELVPIDLDGWFRLFGASVDLGPYEQ